MSAPERSASAEVVDDIVLPLQDTVRDQCGGVPGDLSESFPDVDMYHEIRCSGFILERHKGNPLGGRWALSQENESSNAVFSLRLQNQQIGCSHDTTSIQLRPDETDWVSP